MAATWVLIETGAKGDSRIATGDVLAALERCGEVRRRFNPTLNLKHRIEPNEALRSKIDHAPEE